MIEPVTIGTKQIGFNKPCFLIAEIGINHNGDIQLAKKLIDLASKYGFDAIKFQKRTPELCVPETQKNVQRETPWGTMTYLDYKKRLEFGEEEYAAIDSHCRSKNIPWFASLWDVPSLDFIEQFDVPCHKVPSALITDLNLLRRIALTGKPIIISTGMSTYEEIDRAVQVLNNTQLILLHCTSTYPSAVNELNLSCINSLRERYGIVTGYSGHEAGITPSVVAVAAFGAAVVERHITTNRALWGSDHAASLEPRGMELLTRDIRNIQRMIGDGKKRVYDSEIPIRQKLRRQ